MFFVTNTIKVFLVMFLLLSSHGAFSTCTGAGTCTCTIASTAMNFGSYSFTTSSPTNSTSTVTVTCNSGPQQALSASYVISASLTTAGNPQRSMTGPLSSQLLYNLYTTSARTTIWADGTVGTATISGSCSQPCLLVCGSRTCNQTFTIYGGIPVGQTVRSGSYGATLTITVTF